MSENVSGLHYEAFGLPTDGQTRIGGIDQWESKSLISDGWTLVGVVTLPGDDGPLTRGVYRRVETEALRAALADAASQRELAEAAKKAEAEAEASKECAELIKDIAELRGAARSKDLLRDLIARGGERFGRDAFGELVASVGIDRDAW